MCPTFTSQVKLDFIILCVWDIDMYHPSSANVSKSIPYMENARLFRTYGWLNSSKSGTRTHDSIIRSQGSVSWLWLTLKVICKSFYSRVCRGKPRLIFSERDFLGNSYSAQKTFLNLSSLLRNGWTEHGSNLTIYPVGFWTWIDCISTTFHQDL